MRRVVVVGAGLAGSEAAWQVAEKGIDVLLFEMRPEQQTPAHLTGQFAELVCSNSLGSNMPQRSSGLLKAELRRLGSLVVACADGTSVPAGGALAVDREAFAREVTARLLDHGRVSVQREEVETIPDADVVVIATGPLTSPKLAEAIASLTGSDHLYFYDAMAPIIAADSIDMSVAYRADRYGIAGEGDYLNCPMSQAQYDRFVNDLVNAPTIPLREFEREDPRFFEACLPVEVLARRGRQALAFGPLRPVGLKDPRTGQRPHAVVQLRQDDQAASLFNMVGFQTNLKWSEQTHIFRQIPGLERAKIVRFGQMHRNTFINSPLYLLPSLQFRGRSGLLFAGQITGTEGYVGSVASGLLAGINASRVIEGEPTIHPPRTTMMGALFSYVSSANARGFQPMKANFGLLPALDPPVRRKRERYAAYTQRALSDLESWISESDLSPPEPSS